MIKDKKIPVKIDTQLSLSRLIERVIVIIAIVFLYRMYISKTAQLEEQYTLNEAVHDSLSTWINKDGEKLAKIQVLESNNSETFLKLQTSNQTINNLQRLVKKNKALLKKQGSASVINTETNIEVTGQTEVIGNTYKSSVENKWYSISSLATKDTTTYKLKTFSELNLVIGLEKQGLFKKKKPYGIATDKNPYTNIKDMRIHQVSLPKQANFFIGPVGGVGITGKPIIGIGVGYGLIKFKL